MHSKLIQSFYKVYVGESPFRSFSFHHQDVRSPQGREDGIHFCNNSFHVTNCFCDFFSCDVALFPNGNIRFIVCLQFDFLSFPTRVAWHGGVLGGDTLSRLLLMALCGGTKLDTVLSLQSSMWRWTAMDKFLTGPDMTTVLVSPSVFFFVFLCGEVRLWTGTV